LPFCLRSSGPMTAVRGGGGEKNLNVLYFLKRLRYKRYLK
jgi:hypothetical protein